MSLLELFCDVDDFCVAAETTLSANTIGSGRQKPGPKSGLCLSEIMTILITFHQSRYRDFKSYYTQYVRVHLRKEFPKLVSYQRFVELTPTALEGLCLYLYSRLAASTGIAFIDATALPVCHNRRIGRHKVFACLATRGKTSMGWFYGFKLHLVVNDQGELVAFCLTPGNVDDRKPVPQLTAKLWGKLVGDLASAVRAVVCRGRTTDYTHSQKHEESLDAALGQTATAKTLDHRNHQRPTQECIANRSHQTSQRDQFPGQSRCWPVSLLSSAKEAIVESLC